jgi:hypothetical protein
MHIKPIYLYAILFCIILSFSACSNETDDDFDGVGKLIASRNSARYKKAEKSMKKRIKKEHVKVQSKAQEKVPVEKQVEKKPEKKKFSSEIFYEEKIKIISASSSNTLGIGTAYLNKDGKIVQIKIKRD